MTKSVPKKRVKKGQMTKNELKYGSLPKSLKKFLLMRKKEREETYGKGKAKYYQRTIEYIQESLYSITLAYGRLPSEYSRKIDLRLGLNLLRDEIMKKVEPKDKANYSISQASQGLNFVLTSLVYSDKLSRLFSDDFEKVQRWLTVLDQLEPQQKK